MKKVTKAIIPAAGFGTRFLPASKSIPKEMFPIVDKPVIQLVVEECVASGIKDIIIVINDFKTAIKDHFSPPNEQIVSFLMQGGERKRPFLDAVEKISKLAHFTFIKQMGGYGNATPVRNSESLIGDEPFAVLWADDFIYSNPPRLKQCLDVFEKYGDPVISGIRIENKSDLSKYGIAHLTHVEGNVSKINYIVEKPDVERAPSNMATHGCYILTPDIFPILRNQKPGTGGEYYLVEAIDQLRSLGRTIYSCEIAGGKYYDTGNKLDYMTTTVEFACKHPEIGEPFKLYLKDFIKSL